MPISTLSYQPGAPALAGTLAKLLPSATASLLRTSLGRLLPYTLTTGVLGEASLYPKPPTGLPDKPHPLRSSCPLPPVDFLWPSNFRFVERLIHFLPQERPVPRLSGSIPLPKGHFALPLHLRARCSLRPVPSFPPLRDPQVWLLPPHTVPVPQEPAIPRRQVPAWSRAAAASSTPSSGIPARPSP